MKILLTGFEPFDGSAMNPSEQVARSLMHQFVGGAAIESIILPVDFLRAPGALIAALDVYQPDAVVCLGEASTRPVISIERIAVNLLDFRIPDNAGATMIDQPVNPNGPAAYFSTQPVREILSAMLACGVPAQLSLSAGTYICNQVMYTLLHTLAVQNRAIPAGFIHLPRLPQQAAVLDPRQPSMSLETQVTGIQAAVEVIVRSSQQSLE
jgi:pyroglutamyl-peptidase